MKNLLRLLILMTSLNWIACSNDDGPSAHEKEVKMLTVESWHTQSVQHASDGDLTFQYEDFAITFVSNKDKNTDGDYVVVNGGTAFPDAFGKWTLDEAANVIVLSNDQVLEYELSEDKLTLEFDVVDPGGRVAGISGRFTFVLGH